MKKLLPLLLLFACLTFTAHAQQTSQAYGQPLLVLTEVNPDIPIPGSDVPTFALYETGHIIYKQLQKGGARYYQTQLAQEQLQELIAGFGISQEVLELPQASAPPKGGTLAHAELYINFDTTVVKQVWGDLRGDEKARKAAPAAFVKVFDKLVEYTDAQAGEWLPDKIEVLFTDQLQVAKKPLKWPAGWPNLKSNDTVWRSEKLYSVYLDKKHYPEFMKLMGQLDDQQAVEVNGKTFTVSYRLPFPNITQSSND
jgi:hypothetical protein